MTFRVCGNMIPRLFVESKQSLGYNEIWANIAGGGDNRLHRWPSINKNRRSQVLRI